MQLRGVSGCYIDLSPFPTDPGGGSNGDYTLRLGSFNDYSGSGGSYPDKNPFVFAGLNRHLHLGSHNDFNQMVLLSSGDVKINGIPNACLFVDGQKRFTKDNPVGNYMRSGVSPLSGEHNGFAAVIQGLGGDTGGLLISVGDDNTDEKALDIYNHANIINKRVYSVRSNGLQLMYSLSAAGINGQGNYTYYGAPTTVLQLRHHEHNSRDIIGLSFAVNHNRINGSENFASAGLYFESNTNYRGFRTNGNLDNTLAFGSPSVRWTDIYATNGTIQTSDINEKDEIKDLSVEEKAVATRIKGLFKTFKFKSAIASKGSDKARIHCGVIAQDVEAAFKAENLDPTRYGIFCSDKYYVDQDGTKCNADGTYPEDELALTPDDSEETQTTSEVKKAEQVIEKTRLGIRYEELLAFVISAL
jgi:hypothetical protein